MKVQKLFEDELSRRGLVFTIDRESGRHIVEIEGCRIFISLSNLQRDFVSDGDVGRVSRFVDAMVTLSRNSDAALSTDQLYWSLERNDYKEPPDFRSAMSDQVDRVLVHLSSESRSITSVTPEMLHTLGQSEADAGTKALENLARALSEATVESENIEGVELGFIGTKLPFKASLILAPNLREVVEPVLGWPLMAVVPDRDFLYLWAARHTGFAQRIGEIVLREYSNAPYPISTEVYEIGDEEIRAIGEFPRETEPVAPPNRRPARPRTVRRSRSGGGR